MLLTCVFVWMCSPMVLTAQQNFYTAAVLEHQVVYNRSTNNKADAWAIINSNLEVFEKNAREAKLQGTDIIVFPEYGITGFMPPLRAESRYYLETFPDPRDVKSCPCDSLNPRNTSSIQSRLSCLAKNLTMYIAANVGDVQSCKASVDSSCPPDGAYQYNTDVVYDKDGCLVARYHKEHLFLAEKLIWDTPKTTEFSYFDTEFGRFGLMICFDAVFQAPAVELVEKYNVTDIIFSTAWINVQPHYVSVAYHSGWARTMGINYLAANLHDIQHNYIGSGIYNPAGILNYTFDTQNTVGSLVVAEVPVIKKKAGVDTAGDVPISSAVETLGVFRTQVFGDTFSSVLLNGKRGNASVCQKSVCCYVDFERDSVGDMYALGAFDGLHYLEGTYYLEVCIMMKCIGNRKSGCGKNQTPQSNTTFSYFNFTSTMSTVYSFPEVVTTGYSFDEVWDFIDSGHTKNIIGNSTQPIGSITMMGRNYAKDQLVPIVVIDHGESTAGLTSPAYFLLAISCFSMFAI